MITPEALTPDPPPAELLTRIRMEYREMPGLALTGLQARRLWNLEGALCDAVLAALVREQFLARSKAGVFLQRAGH